MCSGKVYYNILERRREAGLQHVAIVRVEQLYPFPEDEVRAILEKFPKATEICWAQEEPRNQGSWFFMLSRRHLAGLHPAQAQAGLRRPRLLGLPCCGLPQRAHRPAAGPGGDRARPRPGGVAQEERVNTHP